MAPSRLNDSNKQAIVERYRAGESSTSIAEAFGCSSNTVSRTVRSLLSAADYAALKLRRTSKSAAPQSANQDPLVSRVLVSEDIISDSGEHAMDQRVIPSTRQATAIQTTAQASEGEEANSSEVPSGKDEPRLALDDADDYGDDEADSIQDFVSEDETVFHEIAVLPVDIPQVTTQQVVCRPFSSELIPDSVYMLVDKTVELDPRPLSEFPELGVSDPEEQKHQALCLYSSPRAAKRQCGRSQRVIKVPDTQIFDQTSSFLLSRGITHLVLEGSLFAFSS